MYKSVISVKRAMSQKSRLRRLMSMRTNEKSHFHSFFYRLEWTWTSCGLSPTASLTASALRGRAAAATAAAETRPTTWKTIGQICRICLRNPSAVLQTPAPKKLQMLCSRSGGSVVRDWGVGGWRWRPICSPSRLAALSSSPARATLGCPASLFRSSAKNAILWFFHRGKFWSP